MMRLGFLVLFLSVPAFAADPAPAPNAIQKEMQLLHGLVVATLVGIETGDFQKVPDVIEQIHAAKSETQKALRSGAWKPPRQGASVQDFIKQDDVFHDALVDLLLATRQKDVALATRQLGVVLEGCTACHLKFKFPAAPPTKAK